ncbi:putative FY-rich [Trachipleistophora hominis]|uniref:Putative FY-rich n=1 Tax=Trachipleistophora hominis TaxID=72359 RepID=L7JU23_TRAHO|nr:putative FY-rich [Trachipleistophora hominis]
MLFSSELQKLFKEREELYVKKELTYNKLKERIKREGILTHILRLNLRRPVQKVTHQPIILGSSLYRMSVLNVGELPKPSQKEYITPTIVYPINFISKRKYKKYNGCPSKSKDKIFYICKIHDNKDMFEISCDYKKWVGKDCWNEFVKDFDAVSEYNSMEEFFGLKHPQLQRIIEEKGTDELTEYVPLNRRKENGKTENEMSDVSDDGRFYSDNE